MYGRLEYDKLQDIFRCEFPVRNGPVMQVCGKWCRDLVRHVTRHHKITARQYKEMMGLDLNESLMSETTKEKLRAAVEKHGTDINLEAGKVYRFRKGETTVQDYKRSAETQQRLRTLKEKSS